MYTINHDNMSVAVRYILSVSFILFTSWFCVRSGVVGVQKMSRRLRFFANLLVMLFVLGPENPFLFTDDVEEGPSSLDVEKQTVESLLCCSGFEDFCGFLPTTEKILLQERISSRCLCFLFTFWSLPPYCRDWRHFSTSWCSCLLFVLVDGRW